MSKTLKKLAAIDIGSNAMRAAFASLSEDGHLKVFKNYRYPLRLGADVFAKGKISKNRLNMTEIAFSELLMKLAKYQITEVHAVATSALRDANNAKDLIQSIKKLTGIEIQVIEGTMEASLIKNAIDKIIPLQNKVALLIDIGGGSTEITLTRNRRTLFSKSYQFGTVRILKSLAQNSIEKDIENFSQNVKKQLDKYLQDDVINLCIGTGGNLRTMGKLRQTILKRPSNRITVVELGGIYAELVNLPFAERIKRFDLKKDRADVIVPAMAMIEQILIDNNIYEILLPKIGLKEGVLLENITYEVQELHLQSKDQ
jgi:exopolyphosphatase / guanosine-5'-triphosphate,3'-diphosphate pyrophosphatase